VQVRGPVSGDGGRASAVMSGRFRSIYNTPVTSVTPGPNRRCDGTLACIWRATGSKLARLQLLLSPADTPLAGRRLLLRIAEQVQVPILTGALAPPRSTETRISSLDRCDLAPQSSKRPPSPCATRDKAAHRPTRQASRSRTLRTGGPARVRSARARAGGRRPRAPRPSRTPACPTSTCLGGSPTTTRCGWSSRRYVDQA
jgi:hypothetical protein